MLVLAGFFFPPPLPSLHPALEAQPRRVVPKGYLSLGGILGGVSEVAPYGQTHGMSSAWRARHMYSPLDFIIWQRYPQNTFFSQIRVAIMSMEAAICMRPNMMTNKQL